MNRNIRFALMAAILVMVGMLAGFQLRKSVPVEERRQQFSSGFSKIQDAIGFIEQNYVKEAKTNEMVDDAIQGLLEGLDPHSFYITAEEMDVMEEQMQGSFEGIGIEFNILEDTLYVVAVLSGGPSEKVGLQAGDRIVEIDEEDVVGIKNSEVMEKLRGKKGTKVKVAVSRRGMDDPLDFVIVRDQIPLYSVDYSYMMDDKTGYVKVSRFASTTHDEFREHTGKLVKNGMENLILDLRGNPGGYMQMAERIADEFLGSDKMVVYTDGRTQDSKSSYRAGARWDMFEDGGLVILMDYGSASASEIVAGAVQDWDRGLIVGVRSFGKGLVQTQHEFDDGSAMRLVISQYYTPSGRCIQKPFEMSSEKYEEEILERFESGEIYDPTKIDFPDSLMFKTNAGRPVYGGGGIMPDVFVPRDTTTDSDYLTRLISKTMFRQFSYDYLDAHPNFESDYPNAATFNKQFKVDQALVDEFTAFAEAAGVKYSEEDFKVSGNDIKIYIKSFIGRRYFQDDGFYPTYHQSDNVLKRAWELMPQAKELKKKGRFSLK